jgi:hypothetical protein
MSKRLLSVLFPNFVKKEYSQSQRVSQGPFGEGLEKARTYLKPGEQSPEGANVQTGPQGGQYYDEMGGSGAVTQDPSAQGGYDIDYGDPERSAQVREDLDQEGMGVPPAPEAGPEISEDRNVVGGIDYGPAKPEIKPEDVDYGPSASPPDVSEPVFDGQGNIQTPGSDSYSTSELTGSDEETVNALGEQYQQEGGFNPAELLSGYDGPLTEDGIAQHLSDKVQYDDAVITDNDYYNAIDFASWIGSKAGTGTQKMAKMMQKYNVDNKRSDPVILSNKGGRQRK